MGNWNLGQQATQWRSDTFAEGRRSGTMVGDYWSRASGFDPSRAVNEFARGAASEANQYLTQALNDLRGSSVGAGRLNTGFFDADSGRVVRDVYSNLNAQIAQQATNAAGLQVQNNAQMGQFADSARNRYVDMLAGGLDRAQAEENARRRRRSGLLGGLGAVAGGIVGTIFPGVGTAVGAQIGGALGSGLGG